MTSLESLLNGFIGKDSELQSQVNRAQVLRRVQEYLASLPPAFRYGILLGMFYFKFEQLITFRSSQAQLLRWARSWLLPKRMLYQAFKFILLPKIYSEPAVLESMGYASTAERRRNGQC